MGFYNVPIIVAFLASIFVASIQNRAVSFDEKLEIMAGGLADKNIITMLLIFLTAGVFVGVVGMKQCRECCIFYAFDYTGTIFSCSAFYSCMFCIVHAIGNERRNNHAYYAYCGQQFLQRQDSGFRYVLHLLWEVQCLVTIFHLYLILRLPHATDKAAG